MDSGGEDLPVEGIEMGNRWKGFPLEEIGNGWRRSFGGRNRDWQ